MTDKNSRNYLKKEPVNTKPIRVNLFNTQAGTDLNDLLQKEIDKITEEKSKKWGFDFKEGKPIENNGKYQWYSPQ